MLNTPPLPVTLQPRRPPAVLGRLALLAILALAAVWRFPWHDPEWQLVFCESDSLFQLHRVQECLEHYPAVQSVDPYSHYPTGYRVPWVNLHTLFYATIARLAGAQPEPLEHLGRLLSWIPPAFGLLAILVTVAIAAQCTTRRLCILSIALLCAISAEVTRPFLYGIIDHHLFAHLGVLLLVLGRLRRQLVWWWAGLVSLIACTPEAIIFVSLLLGCLCVSDAIALFQNTEKRPLSWPWYISPAVVAVVVWLVHRSLDTDPLPRLALDWMHVSLFLPLWLALLGGGMRAALAAAAARRVRGRTTAVVAVAAVFTAAGVLLLTLSGALDPIVQRLLTPNRVFVGEEAFVFQSGFWSAPAWYRILAFSGVFLVVKLLQALRNRERSDTLFLWITLLAALLLGFKEFRHLYVLSSLQLIGLGLAAFEIERALRGLPMFSGRVTRVLPAVTLGLAIVPFLITSAIANRRALGTVCDDLPVIEELTGWLAHHTPDPQPAGQSEPTYAVFSGWGIGHQIHVLAKRPVVVDPLNYDVEGRFDDALEAVWGSRTADDFMAALAKYGVRYVVLTNPGAEIVGLMRRHNLSKETFVTVAADGAISFLPSMYQFAGFRLFMTSGAGAEFAGLQPRFFTTEAETYMAGAGPGEVPRKVVIPDGQIYEVTAVGAKP